MLPKIIGNASLARELCLTARKFDSKEAMDCGFVNRLFDDKVFIKLLSVYYINGNFSQILAGSGALANFISCGTCQRVKSSFLTIY